MLHWSYQLKALQIASFRKSCTVPLYSHFIAMYNQFKINVKTEIQNVLFSSSSSACKTPEILSRMVLIY